MPLPENDPIGAIVFVQDLVKKMRSEGASDTSISPFLNVLRCLREKTNDNLILESINLIRERMEKQYAGPNAGKRS